jgi:hypothetical protein
MVQEVRPALSLPSAYVGGDHGPGTPGILDEVFIRVGGVLHYLRRAVDQLRVVLDILV